MMLDLQQLEARLGPVLPRRSDKYWRFNCPLCHTGQGGGAKRERPDENHCLFISRLKRGGFGCTRCGAKGTRAKLAGLLHLEERRLSSLTEDLETIRRALAPSSRQSPPQMPTCFPESAPIPPYSKGWEYLRDRGVGQDVIDAHGLLLGLGHIDYETARGPRKAWYRDRIIVPCAPGDPTYFTARTYVDAKPKYRNPPWDKAGTVMFLDSCPKDRVVLVEGVFDRFAGGPDCAPLLGMKATPEQLATLIAYDADLYVVALDGEAVREGTALTRELGAWGLNAVMARLPYKHDAGTLGYEAFRRVVDDARGLEVFP
jgi:hypothetical protein